MSKKRTTIKPEKMRAVDPLRKEERYAFVIQLLAKNLPRPSIVRLLIRHFKLRQRMAYYVYDKAIQYARERSGVVHETYVAHLQFLKDSMMQAMKDGSHGAAAMFADQYADIAGLKREKDQPALNVVLNNTNTNLSTNTTNVDNSQKTIAIELNEMSEDLLHDRLQRFVLGRNRPIESGRSTGSPDADGAGGSQAQNRLGHQPSPERNGTSAEPEPLPVPATSLRRSG